MELLMEEKGNVMDNYLFNLKLTVSKNCINNIMSRCIDLHYLMYYRYDLHCGMSGDWSGEVSWFVSPLSLSQLCQPDHKKQFIKNLSSNSESKTNDKFLTTTAIFFYINKKF